MTSRGAGLFHLNQGIIPLLPMQLTACAMDMVAIRSRFSSSLSNWKIFICNSLYFHQTERILTSRLEDRDLHLVEPYIFFFSHQIVGKYAFKPFPPCYVTGDPFLGSNNAPLLRQSPGTPTYIALGCQCKILVNPEILQAGVSLQKTPTSV